MGRAGVEGWGGGGVAICSRGGPYVTEGGLYVAEEDHM